MKKVLVATCVMAMTAFGVTNASADTVSSARGNAYGLNLSLLGENLLDKEPEVTSVLGQGLVSEDIITAPVEPVTLTGTGVVVANTSPESDIVPFTFDGGAALSGGGGAGGTGSGSTTDGLLGGLFDNLLGGSGGGGGGALGGIAPLSEGDAATVEAQQLDGLTGGGTGGMLGGLLGGDLLGGILGGADEADPTAVGADDEIIIPAVNALGFARVADLNLLVEDSGDSVLGIVTSLPVEIQSLLVDALLGVDAVTSESVAVCVDNQVFFDTSSNILSINNEPVTLVDDLLAGISDLTADLGLLEVATNEVGVTADGNGVFVNALRITVGADILGTGGGTGGNGLLGGLLGEGETPADLADTTGDSVLEVIVGHSEVSGTVCAAQAAPPAGVVQPLQPSGPGSTLPVTGGGLGLLPAVLAVGLTGGAVAAGRVALRSRREDTV